MGEEPTAHELAAGQVARLILVLNKAIRSAHDAGLTVQVVVHSFYPHDAPVVQCFYSIQKTVQPVWIERNSHGLSPDDVHAKMLHLARQGDKELLQRTSPEQAKATWPSLAHTGMEGEQRTD